MSYDVFELLQTKLQNYYTLTLDYGRVWKCANNIYEVMKW